MVNKSIILKGFPIGLFFIFFNFFVSCSRTIPPPPVSLPHLEKQEMYADYDYLLKIVQELNPQLEVRALETGVDILREMKNLRVGIDTCSSTFSFFNLINEAMNLCQDGHNGIVPIFYFENPSWIDSEAIDTINKESIEVTKRYSRYKDSLRKSSKLELPLVYENGKYFVASSFEYVNTVFQEGLELKKVNKVNSDSYINGLLRYKVLHWDTQKNKFFDPSFYRNIRDIGAGSIQLLFQDSQGKYIEKIFDLRDSISFINPQREISKIPLVRYQNSTKTLYIRIPEMEISDTTYYLNEIRKLNTKKIDSVLLDIRKNPGGSDLVGERILENIIGNEINFKIKVVARYSTLLADHYGIAPSNMDTLRVAYLNNNLFWLVDGGTRNIYPDKKSIDYKGIINILVDENIASAAGTLAAYSDYSKNIVRVGKKTGRLLGRGASPIIFRLPNSNALIRIEPLLDIGEAKNEKEIFD